MMPRFVVLLTRKSKESMGAESCEYGPCEFVAVCAVWTVTIYFTDRFIEVSE
jgi:hypothetical protein